MSNKLPPLEVLKDLANGQELPEEILEAVAGGAYTEEEWFAMSEEERKAAQQRSVMAKVMLNIPCELD
jgi:hypothetical protein